MKKLAFILCLFHSLFVFSQGEANYWFFGKNAGLNFNNNTVTPISGSLDTKEGCASFSTNNGDLLFYTDGQNAWDKNGDLMPNGNGTLKGNESSTQSAIIVPHPGNSDLYYIFTVGVRLNNSGEFGLYCYTVDMTKNGGLGDVVENSEINLSGFRSDDWSEKVTSVKGSECNTYWVISLVENTYYSYKIDLNGLDQNPITSTVNYSSSERRGYLKVSPDGKKLASATFTQVRYLNGTNYIGPGKLHLYSFNDTTGKIENNGIEIISNAEIDGAPYGVEFSPNSTKLYTSTYDGYTNKLLQFDITATNIQQSKYLVNSKTGYRGAIQLAPNGKIYATVPISYDVGTKYLNAINSPDELGENCDYIAEAIDLGINRSMQGLPPFIASILLPIEITDNSNKVITNQTVKLCVGSNYTFNTPELSGNPIYSWKYNGVEMPLETSSSLTFNNLQISDEGTYEVKVELTDDCGNSKTYLGKFEVAVFEPPAPFDTIIYNQCDIDDDPTDYKTIFNLNSKKAELINNDPNLEVHFFKSEADFADNIPISNTSAYLASNGTTLIVKLTNKESDCYALGEIQLNVFPTSLENYDTIYTCENDLTAINSNELKSVGSGNGTFDFENIRASIHAEFSNDPTINIEFYKDATDAQLQNNALSGSLNFPDNTEIFVRVSNNTTQNCISVGTFNLIVNPIPIPQGNEEPILLCVNNPRDNPQLLTVELDASTGNSEDSYQWYFNNTLINGATNEKYNANAEGTYKVEVTRNYDTNNSCSGFNSFIVFESSPPIISENDITITDDSVNNTVTISTSNLGIGDYEFSIDNPDFDFQDEPYFDNIKAGIHTIYVKDKNTCGAAAVEISVLGFPKYFTPNNDGSNDTWEISGVNKAFYNSVIIYIYDRFGKLLTQIDLNGNGWNGIYNGEQLPASDYWFTAELIDKKGVTRIRKGHFSLVR